MLVPDVETFPALPSLSLLPIDDRINTDAGQFMWRPQQCDSPESSWYRINPKKKYPRWQKVVIDESEKGDHMASCAMHAQLPNCAKW